MVCITRSNISCVHHSLVIKKATEEALRIDEKINILMKDALSITSLESYLAVQQGIAAMLRKVEFLDLEFEEKCKTSSDSKRWRAVACSIDVLYKNLYLVKQHVRRLHEFACVAHLIDTLWGKLAESSALADPERKCIQDALKMDVDDARLYILSMIDGFAFRPLIAFQRERFESLIGKMTSLLDYSDSL